MTANASQVNKSKKTKKVIKLEKHTIEEKVPLIDFNSEDVIFSLDIGTRTVIGVVGVQEKDKFRVISAEVLEHKNRAMLDGQIHDIGQVAEIAHQVKEILEKKTGLHLTKVAIAAAGRVLKTCQVKVEREIDTYKEIDQELVGSLEMEGIQIAQIRLDEEIVKEEKTQFYCVGYSVMNYYLNDYLISALIGHKGRKIGADILATFLPHIVVDSLYTVMSKVGLEVVSLTLEPIAAINVTIPKDLRLLNLALVDIGAGTSDIALTKDGSVVAYAMAPIAGDEITEKITQQYLVDFNTGEKIKTSLSSAKDNVSFIDILGNKYNVKVSEVMEVVEPAVELLAETISQKILEYNHKAPNAVFLIGGGSQIPGLTESIAKKLKLPSERVAVRGRNIIQNIKFSGKKLSGPEAITPFGIAITAQMQKGQDFLAVTINGKKIRLFNSKKLTVADALILIGFNPNQLIGRSGKSISFDINGVKKTVRGEFGKAAEIYVNGTAAHLETVLNAGDNIKVVPAEDGKNATAKVSDHIKTARTGKITFNSSVFDLDTKVCINGKIATLEDNISDGDSIQVSNIETVGDFVKLYEINTENQVIVVNGKVSDESWFIQDKDNIECIKKFAEKKEDIINSPEALETGKADISNEVQQVVAPDEKTVVIEPIPADSITLTINGKKTNIKGKSQYIFVDIFNYIDFDLSKPKGNIVLKLNGSQASFTDSIKSGDVIDIYWDQQ